MITGGFSDVKVAFLAVNEQILLHYGLLNSMYFTSCCDPTTMAQSETDSAILRHLEATSQHLWRFRRPLSMCKWHLAPALSPSIFICLIFAFFFFFFSRLLSMFSCCCSVAMSKTSESEALRVSPGVQSFMCLKAKYDRAVLLQPKNKTSLIHKKRSRIQTQCGTSQLWDKCKSLTSHQVGTQSPPLAESTAWHRIVLEAFI